MEWAMRSTPYLTQELIIFKVFVKQLAKEKGYEKEYALYEMVEHMAPEVIAEKRKIYKA